MVWYVVNGEGRVCSAPLPNWWIFHPTNQVTVEATTEEVGA